jgi:serine/threonine protein kinase
LEIEPDVVSCPQCRFLFLTDDIPEETPAGFQGLIPEKVVWANDYRIIKMVGKGGAGIVYEARQIGLQNMPVALKVLHPDLNEDANTIALLKKEVIIARELSHDSIMKVYSLEKYEGRHFIVMEFVPGQSLQSVLERAGKCSLETVVPIFVQVADALQYAHERGVIHLDIKPANILIHSSGSVKLCDFGIARMSIGNVTTATQRLITGSVGYMPPEQYRGRKFVSNKSDIYALAATTYHALTGEVPVGEASKQDLPPSLYRSLRRRPEERFQTVGEFREAFLAETGFGSIAPSFTTRKVTLPAREDEGPDPLVGDHPVPVSESVPTWSADYETVAIEGTGVGEAETVVIAGMETVHTAQAGHREVLVPPPEGSSDEMHTVALRHDEPLPGYRAHTATTKADAPLAPADVSYGLDSELAHLPAVLHESPQVPPDDKQSFARRAIWGFGFVAAVLILALAALMYSDLWKTNPVASTERPGGTESPVSGVIPPSSEPSEQPARDFVYRAGAAPGSSDPAAAADPETVQAVEATLGRFVDSLNFDQFDQGYMYLGSQLRKQLSMEEFRRVFFRSPRLWKLNVERVGKGDDGNVLVNSRFQVVDAFRGEAGKLSGKLVMAEEPSGWKIIGFELG